MKLCQGLMGDSCPDDKECWGFTFFMHDVRRLLACKGPAITIVFFSDLSFSHL